MFKSYQQFVNEKKELMWWPWPKNEWDKDIQKIVRSMEMKGIKVLEIGFDEDYPGAGQPDPTPTFKIKFGSARMDIYLSIGTEMEGYDGVEFFWKHEKTGQLITAIGTTDLKTKLSTPDSISDDDIEPETAIKRKVDKAQPLSWWKRLTMKKYKSSVPGEWVGETPKVKTDNKDTGEHKRG